MLERYRVLDLTDERGQLAGAMLAALGAEVILIEPPGGSHSRTVGPWAGDRRDAEASLGHWGYNRGKKSVVLDVRHEREAFENLARGADVLIEAGSPAQLLSYADTSALNPALVHVSITPFGSDGPKADWAATDLTVWASSMTLQITGDPDRAPLRVSVPQAFLHASSDAVAGALIALHERESSGLGQHIDISAQQSSMQATLSQVLAAPLRASPALRAAGGTRLGPLHIQLFWPCKNGHVAIAFLFGAAIGPATQRLMQLVCEDGCCDEATRDKDWIGYVQLLVTGAEPTEEYARVKECVGAFCATRTKQELLDLALERRLLIAPVANAADVVGSEHFSTRGYWDEVHDPEIKPDGPVRAPGAFAKPSATPLVVLGRAPRLGEHTEHVLGSPARAPAAPAAPAASDRQPFEGLKVLDFMWAMAGPGVTQVLADYGATIVRVESATKLDVCRTIQPFMDDQIDPERSGLFFNLNRGKLGCAINCALAGAKDLIHDLVRWADVVCESYSPRAMRAWGLGYEQLREINPSIVMFSSCLMGQTGPLAMYAGYGNLAAAIAGFVDVTGWPDRSPAGPFGAYTDYVAPRFGLAALLAALDHRRRTGEGQHIDLSQAEAAMHFLTPSILDYTVNGNLYGRLGNADPGMAPHGVYACSGSEEWVAIACATDDQWRALSGLIGRSDLEDEPLAARLAGRSGIDKLVEAWTSTLSPSAAADRCQTAGVPAHAVQTSADCLGDAQLAHRGHWVELEHQTLGPVTVEGARMRLSRTPARVVRASPTLGQDTVDVLTDILGYDEEKIGDLFAAQLLE
jgi:crotonobetainyl-CoA:carnitine CoA-transferase CaiB-like acyl-CoA transferase